MLGLKEFYPVKSANFNLVAYDLQDGEMIDLSLTDHQRALFPLIKDSNVLILDSIATLFRGNSDPNDSRSWNSIQTWLLALRKHGIAVIILHHDGKNGSQRGTSAKEDILDNIIQLKNPENYNSSDGCRFELHFRKNRSCFGESVESKIVELTEAGFSHIKIVDPIVNQILDMKDKMTQKQIAERMGISVGKVNKIINMNKT